MMSASFARSVPRAVFIASVWIAGAAASLHAQGTIAGRVTATGSNEPLSDARLLVVGANASSTTGGDGRYRLSNVRAGTVEVQVLRVGYASQKKSVAVTAGRETILDFTLTVAVVQLQEVVTTATGQQRKVELGNALATIDVAKLAETAPIRDMSDLLTARAPSVSVVAGNYTGAAAQIRIRGLSSISNSGPPIYIVDGVRIDASTGIGLTGGGAATTAYTGIQQARGYFRNAINAMVQWVPDDSIAKSRIGELYFGLGFLEMQMAEALCNGVPIGEVRDGLPVYSASKTNADLFALAGAHLDTALALAVAKDTAYSVKIRNAALVTKARILVDLGQFASTAALSAQVPTAYQYTLTFSTGSGLNGNWSLNTSQSAYSVADSVDATGVVKNAIPFVSAKDVRVPTANANKTGIDGTTPLFTTSIWANTGQIPVVSGVDARLIDAEAKLNANDIAGMMTILNGLRTAAQTLGTFRPAVQAVLPTPTTQAAATTLFFREKAFWTFGRGQRLGDLRRMIRQYKLAPEQVLPTGNYYKGGAYGSDVNFPVPDVERANPQFAGCIDRNA